MWLGIVTLFPQMFATITEYGVSGRAFRDSKAQLMTWNPRDFTEDKHRTVDDRPYGGGPGMLMKVEPLAKAIEAAQQESTLHGKNNTKAKVIYLTPQGQPFKQASAQKLAGSDKLIFVAGRYEGIDERLVESLIDEEWSVGDFVLSGGELAAMTIIDSVLRLIPGVLGHVDSADQDSFSDGLLDCPHYTRPEKFAGKDVPKVLLSGDHQAIAKWRRQESLKRTALRRKDLLENIELSVQEQKFVASVLKNK